MKTPLMWSQAYKHKLILPENLKEQMKQVRDNHKTMVTLNGSFDLLHAGHLQIIYEASQQGDCLLVALNSDSSIQKYKNINRPIISLENRLQMIAALTFVTYVTWFNETDPCQLLEIIKPDVHVNGSEYGEMCIEAETVRNNGGRLYLVNRIPSLSTTEVIQKIKIEG